MRRGLIRLGLDEREQLTLVLGTVIACLAFCFVPETLPRVRPPPWCLALAIEAITAGLVVLQRRDRLRRSG